MYLDNAIGQSGIKEKLREMVAANRLSHALLFLGKEGAGALTLAIGLAELLVVKEGQVLQHPDIHFTFPVIKKDIDSAAPTVSDEWIGEWREFLKGHPYGNAYDWLQSIGAENRQGNITARECSEILRKLSLKSFSGGFKVQIVWMPEYLGNEGNKLLKLIEEPPPYTIFLLVAEDESALLPTILSRCQLLRVPPIADADIEAALVARAGAKPDEARTLARLAEGNYREAQRLMQHETGDHYHLLRDWLNATVKYDLATLLKTNEEIAKLGREGQKAFLRYFMQLLESALRMGTLPPEHAARMASGLTSAEQDMLPRLNKALSLEAQDALATELDRAIYQVERNANPKILFHALSIRVYYLVKHGVVAEV